MLDNRDLDNRDPDNRGSTVHVIGNLAVPEASTCEGNVWKF